VRAQQHPALDLQQSRLSSPGGFDLGNVYSLDEAVNA